MSVVLRAATHEDEHFLMQVYASTRLEELDRTPWNQTQREAFVRMQFHAQQHHYNISFPAAEYQIILLDAHPVGRLYVARLERTIRILDITILAERRNAGIGTSILAEILKESEESAKPVQIYVESFNPSLRLFERLGFSKVDASDYNFLMEWAPVPGD